jgi:pimeloyl-ACP methyl ester carboxylesterase
MTTSALTSRDGTRIGYRRVGSGPAVVVMHGALGTALSWLAVAQRLADRFELFLVDRRGRGASGAGAAPHSLAREVDDAAEVLRVAGPGAALVGHSYGGAVALEAARRAEPGAIGRLVLYEPGVAVAGLVPPAQVARIEELVRHERLAEALEIGIEQLDAAGLVRADPPQGPPPDALLRLAPTLPREIRAVDALGSDLSRYASITQPTLLMVGDASPERQRRNCMALAGVLANVRVEELAGLGHVAHNADPDRVAAAIASFLR